MKKVVLGLFLFTVLTGTSARAQDIGGYSTLIKTCIRVKYFSKGNWWCGCKGDSFRFICNGHGEEESGSGGPQLSQ